MKLFIIIAATVFLFSCANSNYKNNSSSTASTNKSDARVVDNSNLVCKKTRKTGSRLNSRICITKEQQLRERRESQEALQNATNTIGNIVPGASNN